MKTIKQIAKETNQDSREIYRVMTMLEITPTKNIYQELDQYQEDLIHHYLYCCGKFEFLVLESKMNITETFKEFKQNTYTRL